MPGRRTPMGRWPTGPAPGLTARGAPHASAPRWLDAARGRPWPPWPVCASPPRSVARATMSLSGAWSRHAPHGAVASRVSSGRCMMLRMRNGGDTAARPWPRTSGPGVPSAGDGAAKPRAAVARGGRGPARPPALALRPTVLGIPAACALTRAQLPWWSPWLPGRPPPDRRPAGRQSPSASARPRSPRPGVETAGRAPRDGACGARRPPREAPPGAGPAPRRLARAQPPCRRWALATAAAGMAVPVPALISAATCDAAQPRVERHVPLARRHQTTEAE